ncbi:TetR family transcriptional regulator, partial [Gordonia paraffinivorans]
ILDVLDALARDAADPSASGMLIELLRRAGDDPELLAVVGRTANVLREGLAALISRGITEGAIDPDLDATETAAWLQAIVDATYLNARPGHSPHIELHRTVLGYLNPPQGRQEEPNG